ncbi:tetraspanin-8-like [Xyrichtys novacula]|uniref:Tetraspanin-8-like n=1 Tax=Xyrichtys novacula TaxID=13765 RepID=A0AAV1F038_XYRNO|nr:tetraspanin-8-like [Xyrichtys novacula]
MNNHRICHICYPCCISSSTVAGSPAPLCHCAVLSLKSNAPTSPVSTVPHCSRNFTLHQRLHCIFFSSTANMAKVNGCLKCIFTGFNIFFAIVGGAIIGLALLSQVYTNTSGSEMEGRTTSLLSLYILGTVTMIVAILGAYGANKENKVCLIVFLVCMIVGALAMLRAGFVATAARPLVEPQLEEKFRQLLPLNEAPEEAKAMADGLQTMAHCCGLFSYNDWGNDIPDSCMCDEEEQEEGLCQSVGYRVSVNTHKRLLHLLPYYHVLRHAPVGRRDGSRLHSGFSGDPGHDSVLHHHPPAPSPRQAHRPAVRPRRLHAIYSQIPGAAVPSSQIPGAAQSTTLLEEGLHLSALTLASTVQGLLIYVVSLFMVEFEALED